MPIRRVPGRLFPAHVLVKVVGHVVAELVHRSEAPGTRTFQEQRAGGNGRNADGEGNQRKFFSVPGTRDHHRHTTMQNHAYMKYWYFVAVRLGPAFAIYKKSSIRMFEADIECVVVVPAL